VSFKRNKNDIKLLASIAESRIMTLSQVAATQRKSKQVVRRRMRDMEAAGLIISTTRGLGKSRGRPEKEFSLSEKGCDLLRFSLPALKNIPNDRLIFQKLHCPDHQLLVNWFRIHMMHIEHVVPQLSVRFLSFIFPHMVRGDRFQPVISKQVPGEDQLHDIKGFKPDGVFSITHQGKQKTLLFFLEADMGTESIASVGRVPRDIRQKIINYQQYFQSGKHKVYEKLLDCSLKGFRLLFLTNTRTRLVSLCKLVQRMPPSDFIWLSTAEQMLSLGLSTKIWVRGGRIEEPEESILGSELACRAPLLPLKE